MPEVDKLVATYELDTRGFERGIKRVENLGSNYARGAGNDFKKIEQSSQQAFSRMQRDGERAYQGLERSSHKTASGISGAFDSIKNRFGFGGSGSGGGGGFIPGLGAVSEIIQGIPTVGRLVGGLVSPITQAAEAGVKFNAFLETSKIGFETMLGSADKAQAHLNQLQAFAAKTPFQFTDLVEASQRMQAFGFSAEKVLPILTAVGDSLSATGKIGKDDLDGVIRQFGQIRAAGHVTAEDMNSITDHGIPAWDLLAKGIGKSVAEVRKLSEAGRLRGPESVDIITAEMEKRYGGQMTRVSGTLTGRLSNLEDLREQAQGLATQKITSDLNATLATVLSKGDAATSLASGINTAIAPVSGLINASIQSALTGGLTSALTAVEAQVSVLAKDIGGNISVGTADGITGKTDHVVTSTLAMGLGIISSFKDLLGINSPSTVFIGFGENMGEGLAIGLRSKQQEIRKALDDLLDDPRIKALIDAIGKGEGTFDPKTGKHIYNKIFGGKRIDLGEEHPGIYVPFKNPATGKMDTSSAAGYGQFLQKTWRGLEKSYGTLDFRSAHDQELGMLLLANKKGALGPLMRGDVTEAFKRASPEWASLPFSKSGQPKQNLGSALDFYNQRLGLYANGKSVDNTNPMPVRVVASVLSDLTARSGGWANAPQSTTPRELIRENTIYDPVSVDGGTSFARLDESVNTTYDRLGDVNDLILQATKKMDGLASAAVAVAGGTTDAATASENYKNAVKAIPKNLNWNNAGDGFERSMTDAFDRLASGEIHGAKQFGSESGKEFLQGLAHDASADLSKSVRGFIFGDRKSDEDPNGGKPGGLLGGLFGGLFGGNGKADGSSPGSALYVKDAGDGGGGGLLGGLLGGIGKPDAGASSGAGVSGGGGILNGISSLFGGLFGHRATGGFVGRGLYEVGEQGNEYVLNARATGALGPNMLQQLNSIQSNQDAAHVMRNQAMGYSRQAAENTSGGRGSSSGEIRIINVTETSHHHEITKNYLNSSEGGRVIINALRANMTALQTVFRR